MSSQNLLHFFLATVDRSGQAACFRYKANGIWHTLSWEEAEGRVFSIAQGLASLGVKRGDAVAIFSSTRMEWTLCDLAILSLGAITVPVYQSSTAEQATYILKDSEAKIVIVENLSLYERVKGTGVGAVLISGEGGGNPVRLQGLLETKGDKAQWRRGIDQIGPEDLATYVYTSGTTGPPKGAMLTHRNFMAEVESLQAVFDITVRDESLLFLPLAHIVARALQFFQLKVGFVQAYAEGIDQLGGNLTEIRPYFFVAVPRIFEKVREKILAQVQAGSPLKKAIFTWAIEIGRQVAEQRRLKQGISLSLRVKHLLADRLVFGKLAKKMGGRLRFAVSGGAPLGREIGEFFAAAGIIILEGYGLTETTAAINCNRPDAYCFGSVGPIVKGVEEKIAPDGEIMVRGPLVFQGYFKKPEATAEALESDGWFHTGDIGEFDAQGFLRITDRKKDIIVTAGGKKVAPQNLENLLKTVPFISQAMVLGDKRKYIAALVTLNQETVEGYAKREGIAYRSFGELTAHPLIRQRIQQAIEEMNKQLASFESIKKFAILEGDFSQETGELTPTLKVKRKFVTEKYKDVLSGLYPE